MSDEKPFAVKRIMEKVHIMIDGSCWEWSGGTRRGYGRANIDYRDVPVHRFMYELLVGPIPDGLVIDHLCRNRLCCNPSHLECVTSKTNVLRGVGPTADNKKKTSCVRGHPLTECNMIKIASRPMWRACLECHNRRQRERKRAIRLLSRAAALEGGAT